VRPREGSFKDRITTPPVILDGALGTELERRGVATGLPLWSTHALLEAPEVIRRVHDEALRAGAEVLTAATFRTQARTLARSDAPGLANSADELTARAVGLARQAADAADAPIWIAGSAPPLEDCYRPDLVPAAHICEREQRAHVRNLARAGVDIVAIETMNTAAEATIAAHAAAEEGLLFWVSFVCTKDARLLSGEPLADAIAAVRGANPLAVGVNCLPPSAVPPCLAVLAGSGLPFCVYPNLGAPEPVGNAISRTEDQTPHSFATNAASWLQAGASLIGGCCGTTPDHIEALSA
jgi:S-methylmethionine-dependent homocysteine/selenocysteine methylase